MKVATVSIAGERRVGRVTDDGRSIVVCCVWVGVFVLVCCVGCGFFDIPTIIEMLSVGITRQSGDVIATGTPAGVGVGFDPARYLKNGDVVRIEIGGIGVLENEIVERSA